MLKCSFCSKTEDQVAKLVAGPRVYICDECVNIAAKLMKGETGIFNKFWNIVKRVFGRGSYNRVPVEL